MTSSTRQIVWHVERALLQLAAELDGEALRWHIGKNAELAWDGGGLELVESYLINTVKTGDSKLQQEILEGLAKLGYRAETQPLVDGLVASRSNTAQVVEPAPVAAPSVAESECTATVDDVMAAFRHFVEQAVAALRVARFGDDEERIALARFEGFRFCWLATRFDDSIAPAEHDVLCAIAAEFAAATNEDQSLNTLVRAATTVQAAIVDLPAKSLVLRIVQSNVGVSAKLQVSAIALMLSTVALDAMSEIEHQELAKLSAQLGQSGAITEIQGSLIVVPRPGSGLRADAVHDELLRCYRAAVPWNLAAGI